MQTADKIYYVLSPYRRPRVDEERQEDFDDLKGPETAHRRKFIRARSSSQRRLRRSAWRISESHFTIRPAFGVGQGGGEVRVSGGGAADRRVGAAELGGRHAAGAAEADQRQHLARVAGSRVLCSTGLRADSVMAGLLKQGAGSRERGAGSGEHGE